MTALLNTILGENYLGDEIIVLLNFIESKEECQVQIAR